MTRITELHFFFFLIRRKKLLNFRSLYCFQFLNKGPFNEYINLDHRIAWQVAFRSNGMSFYVWDGLIKVDVPLMLANNLHDLEEMSRTKV